MRTLSSLALLGSRGRPRGWGRELGAREVVEVVLGAGEGRVRMKPPGPEEGGSAIFVGLAVAV